MGTSSGSQCHSPGPHDKPQGVPQLTAQLFENPEFYLTQVLDKDLEAKLFF